MVQETLMIITLVSIWLSLCMSIVTLSGATDFWLAHSTKRVTITPLSRYPMITIVVPAHNEEVVIAQTTRAILDMNYPADRVELLLFADIRRSSSPNGSSTARSGTSSRSVGFPARTSSSSVSLSRGSGAGATGP